jgi:hypothetical protein
MLNGYVPFAFLRVPLGLLYFLACPDILIDIMLSCDPLPVISNLMSLGELFSPLGIG